MDMQKLSQIYKYYTECYSVSTDSRNVISNSMFFALKGNLFNGNMFAEQAYRNGCRYCVIDQEEFKLNDDFLLVDDVLLTMQNLARYHISKLDIPILCLTGSNGKTTTKELISAILSSTYNISSTKGNFNNEIGVPITLLSIDPHSKLAVVELGANHIGEIDFLSNMAQPKYGLITNFGKAHLEGFGSEEGVVKGKLELFEYVKKSNGKLFINNADDIQVAFKDVRHLSYGFNSDVEVKLLDDTPFVKLDFEGIVINSNLVGSYNYDNIAAAIAVGIEFGVSINRIKKSIESYIPNNNRSQIINTKNNIVLLDAYNANPTSMEAAIKSFVKRKEKNKVLILGDMLELGKYANVYHASIVDLIKKYQFKSVYFIGKKFKEIEKKSFLNKKDFLSFIKTNPIEKSFVLIKGSRGFKLEEILDFL